MMLMSLVFTKWCFGSFIALKNSSIYHNIMHILQT